VTHAVVVLLSTLLLAPLLSFVPMAALAALLLLVAWNMSEARHFWVMLRIAPRSDNLVLVTCFALTVLFDMVVAVSVGVVLASLLFMKRTADLTQSRLLHSKTAESDIEVPHGVAVYEVAGPLFFGAAQNAMNLLHTVDPGSKVVVLALGRVPSIDATGLVALESALSRLQASKKRVIIAGPLPEPRKVFDKAKLPDHHQHLSFEEDLPRALELARKFASAEPSLAPAAPAA
jgi:SulP family sulfate permease